MFCMQRKYSTGKHKGTMCHMFFQEKVLDREIRVGYISVKCTLSILGRAKEEAQCLCVPSHSSIAYGYGFGQANNSYIWQYSRKVTMDILWNRLKRPAVLKER